MTKRLEDLVQHDAEELKKTNKGFRTTAPNRDSLFADLKKAAQRGREERGDPRPERESRIAPVIPGE